MVFIVSLSSFMEFEGQTSKNVHNIRKDCLETTLCVLTCFVECYMFILDEIYVRGPKIVYKHIRVEKVGVKLPKDQRRVLEEGPLP